MRNLRWLRSIWWALWFLWCPALAGATTYKLSFVPAGGSVEISQEVKLAAERDILFEEDSRAIYQWFAEKAHEQGKTFPFVAWLKDCAKGKKGKCPKQTPWVKLVLQYEGKSVHTYWPIQSKKRYFFEAIFKQHPSSWYLAGMLLRLARWDKRHAFRLLQALEAYAESLGEKKIREFAYLVAEQFAVHRASPETRFYYLLEEHLPKLEQEKDGKSSAFVSALRSEIYEKNRFNIIRNLQGNRVGRGFSDLLRLLTANADLCDDTKKTTLSNCHGKESLLYLRRWVLRSAYRTAYELGNHSEQKFWLAHAGHIFDRSDGIEDRGEGFTLDHLLDESDPDERISSALRKEGIEDAGAYRRMILEVIGRLKITDPYQRRRAYRRLLPLAQLQFLRTEVGLALRSIFDLEKEQQRKEVFDILWEDGQEGKRGERLFVWADTFFASPQNGWAEAYHPHTKLSPELHQEFHALRQTPPADRAKGEKAWRILLAAAAARLERGDDLRDPAVLSWEKQAVLLQAALKYGYNEACMMGSPECKGARFILAGRLLRHLTSWKRIDAEDKEQRETEVQRHFSNLTSLFAGLPSVENALLKRYVWLLRRMLPRWSSYRKPVSLEERGTKWIQPVKEAFEQTKGMLNSALKNPKHFLWERIRALSALTEEMGLVEGCSSEQLTEELLAYNQLLYEGFREQQNHRNSFYPVRDQVLTALAKMHADKVRHCRGKQFPKLDQVKAALATGFSKKQNIQNLSWLQLNKAIGAIGQAKTPENLEDLQSLFGIDKIQKPYEKERDWIDLWGRLSLEKNLPCDELTVQLKKHEKAAHPAFAVLREVLWLQAQSTCIHRRKLFSAILPASQESTKRAITSWEELGAAKYALSRLVKESGVPKEWNDLFDALAEEALQKKVSKDGKGGEAKDFTNRWLSLQRTLRLLLRKENADWPEEKKRFAFQGAVLAHSFLNHLYSIALLLQAQEQTGDIGREVPAIHPLRYLQESGAKDEIGHLKKLIDERNQEIRRELREVVEGREAFFERRRDERQKIYNDLQRAYLELGEMRLEAEKLGYSSQVLAIRQQLAQGMMQIARKDIELAERHQQVAVLRKEREQLEKALRKEGVDLSVLDIRIKKLEEGLVKKQIQGHSAEQALLSEERRIANQLIQLNQRRNQQIDNQLKQIEARNQQIDQEIEAIEALFPAMDQQLRLIEHRIQKGGETVKLIRKKGALIVEKRRKIEQKLQLIAQKSLEIEKKKLTLEQHKLLILRRNEKTATLWMTRIKETELSIAALHNELIARKAAIDIVLKISSEVIKKADESLAQVRAAQAEHERRMAQQRRRSFWSSFVSIAFRVVGAAVGAFFGNPMLGLQIGGLVGDFIAKGAIEGNWDAAWKGLGVGAITLVVTAGIGDGGLGKEIASGIGNSVVRAGVEQLANTAINSLIQNAVQAIQTGDFKDVLGNTLKEVVRDLPNVAVAAISKIQIKGNFAKALKVFKFVHEEVLGKEIKNITRLTDGRFLQERALAVGMGIAKSALKDHAPEMFKIVEKAEEFQSKYNLFPRPEDIFKDGLKAFEIHLKQRVEELPKELFEKHLKPEIEGFLRRHTPKAFGEIEAALRGNLGIEPKDILQAIRHGDMDILKTKFREHLPKIQEAVLGGLQKHFNKEIKQIEALRDNVQEKFSEVKTHVQKMEEVFRHRLSRSLEQIESLGRNVEGDVKKILHHIQPDRLIEELERKLKRSLPDISAEHLQGIVQYQAQRYASLVTRFHALRTLPDWRGKEEYLRFALLGREQAAKLLAQQTATQAQLRKVEQRVQTLRSLRQKYGALLRVKGTKLRWQDVQGQISGEIRKVIPDPMLAQQELQILDMQINPVRVTRIISDRTRRFEDTLTRETAHVKTQCNHGFGPCITAFENYKKNTHSTAQTTKAMLEREITQESDKLHKANVKKRKQEIKKEIDNLRGQIKATESDIKQNQAKIDALQNDIQQQQAKIQQQQTKIDQTENDIAAEKADIALTKAYIKQSEMRIQRQQGSIQSIGSKIKRKEGDIAKTIAQIQATTGLIALEDSKKSYLRLQRAIVRSGWTREVLMFRKQQGVYTTSAMKIRSSQAQKRLQQAVLTQREAGLRLEEAGILLGRENLKEEVEKGKATIADIEAKIGKIRKAQQRLKEASLWQRIDALEASLRAVDEGVFPAIRQKLLSPGWALQELRQLQNASLERMSLNLSAIFYALEQANLQIPAICHNNSEKTLEKLPAYLESCLLGVRQLLASSDVQTSCKSFVIEPRNLSSLLSEKEYSSVFQRFLSNDASFSFVLHPSLLGEKKHLSLVRVSFWLDVEEGEQKLRYLLPEQADLRVNFEQTALGSKKLLGRRKNNVNYKVFLRSVNSSKDQSDPIRRCEPPRMFSPDQVQGEPFLYIDPLMRWTLKLTNSSEIRILRSYRPVRFRMNVVYIEPKQKN